MEIGVLPRLRLSAREYTCPLEKQSLQRLCVMHGTVRREVFFYIEETDFLQDRLWKRSKSFLKNKGYKISENRI